MNLRTMVALSSIAAICIVQVACGGGGGVSISTAAPPPLMTYSISGTVASLAAGDQVVLLNNGGDSVIVTANGAFTFSTPVASNGEYVVTVGTQPVGQVCSVSNGSGAGITANVKSVAVNCSAVTFSIGGSIAGLGNGMQLTLFNNGADALTLAANGGFTFVTPVVFDGNYSITAGGQPAGQVCTVSNGAGGGVTANVSSVTVKCSTDTFTIGGTLSGLNAGKQVTLYNNGGDALTLNAVGPFTFATPVAFSGNYAVTVGTQSAGQICSVADGTGTNVADKIMSVSVVCNTPGLFTISGTVSGLAPCDPLQLALSVTPPGGTASVVSTLTIGSNGAFTMPTAIPTGDHYSVSYLVQPENQNCQTSSDNGTVGTANVTSVVVTCLPTFSLGSAVTGPPPGDEIKG